MRSEYGDVLTIQSDNENIYDILEIFIMIY